MHKNKKLVTIMDKEKQYILSDDDLLSIDRDLAIDKEKRRRLKLESVEAIKEKNQQEWESEQAFLDLKKHWLKEFSPAKIEKILNERIVGQPELTKSVANFLYYHILRQVYPELPPRPMLISGPSGSGKTEVWRAIQLLESDLCFDGMRGAKDDGIKIIDGASLTADGWKGENKISTQINNDIAEGGILVIDEFDKLATPQVGAYGTNHSALVQAELLKLLEGELTIIDPDAGCTSKERIETHKMGIVLVGAFESINEKYRVQKNRIGFNTTNQTSVNNEHTDITDEDFIKYGVLTELMGRICTKCHTKELADEDYIAIIRNPHSRVSKLIEVLRVNGVKVDNIIDDEKIKELIKQTRTNKTGARWVSAQIENKILDLIYENGICPDVAYLSDCQQTP